MPALLFFVANGIAYLSDSGRSEVPIFPRFVSAEIVGAAYENPFGIDSYAVCHCSVEYGS